MQLLRPSGMNVLKTIIENGGLIENQGILTLFSLDFPSEIITVEWKNGSREEFKAQAALEAISIGELMGKHAQRVFLSPESVAKFYKANKQAAFKKMREVFPGASYAEIKNLVAQFEETEKLKVEHGDFFKQVSAILFRHDPEKIACRGNEDEYDSETATIIPRLAGCQSVQDCWRVIHEESIIWFDGHVEPKEKYAVVAAEIWELWQKQKSPTLNL